MEAEFLEVDMFSPIKSFLTEQGYFVQAEVKGIDIAAKKGDTLVIIEMKRSFQLKLVY